MEIEGISLYVVAIVTLQTDVSSNLTYIWMQDRLSQGEKKQKLIEHYEVDIMKHRVEFRQVPTIT